MTQADSATALRRSLDPEPITDGQGQAKKITARTPLPCGWASFCSKPDSESPPHWYATPPWDLFELKERLGRDAWGLAQTVSAETWVGLHHEVQRQVELYEALVQDFSEK